MGEGKEKERSRNRNITTRSPGNVKRRYFFAPA